MKLLDERAKTHGDYLITSKITQRIKNMIRNSPSYPDMTLEQRESLDMIAMKMARIMSGDPSEPDHFRDIAGYALLAIGEGLDGKDNKNK